MTDTTVKIEPCPFCGSDDIEWYEYGPIPAMGDVGDSYCQCNGCTTCGPSAATANDAIAAWNRRSPALSAIEADRNKRAGSVADTDRIESLERQLAEAQNTMLWLYRRLPRGYGRVPHVDRAIKALAAITGAEVDTFLAERDASPAPDISTPSTHPQEVSDEEILATFNSIRIKESGWSNTREQRDVVLKTVRAILAAQGRKA